MIGKEGSDGNRKRGDRTAQDYGREGDLTPPTFQVLNIPLKKWDGNGRRERGGEGEERSVRHALQKITWLTAQHFLWPVSGYKPPGRNPPRS